LLHPKAPHLVRIWAGALPGWVNVRNPKDSSQFFALSPGERDALALALETNATFLLIDETRGRSVAVAHGIPVKGILAVLEEAASKRWIDLPEAINRLRATSIFLSDEVVQTVLRRTQERLEKEM
jgi:predicted nucleic acid-binding protein